MKQRELGVRWDEWPRNPVVAGARRPLFTAKDLFWFVYLFPVRWLSILLPPALFVRAGMFLAPLCCALSAGTRRRMEDAMEKALGLAREECRVISGGFVSNSLRRSLDDLLLNGLAEKGEWRCMGVHGLDNLERAFAAGKGVVLVTGHFFASRIAKRYLDSIGFPVLTIRNGNPTDQEVGLFGKRYLQRRYVSFLHGVIRDEVFIQDPELTLKIMRRLRRGGIVNIHLDAAFSVETATLPFLGEERRFPAGFIRLARACGATILPMHYSGNMDGFSLSIGASVPSLRIQDTEGETRTILVELAGVLESGIRSRPDEWELWGIMRRGPLNGVHLESEGGAGPELSSIER